MNPHRASDRNHSPEFLFPWHRRNSSLWAPLGALLAAIALFALLLSFVRVKVAPAPRWIEDKATVIQLSGDADAQAWALRAIEAGPFPTRFDPSGSPDARALEIAAIRESAVVLPPYQPTLRALPAPAPPVLPAIAAAGERLFPRPSPVPPVPAVEPVPWRTVPVLLPLSDLPANALPSPVPAFPGHIDAETAAESWRFLIHLRADGSVADCIPLNSSGRSGATALAAWIGGMNFHPDLPQSHPWIALAVGFTNLPDDGPDPR